MICTYVISLSTKTILSEFYNILGTVDIAYCGYLVFIVLHYQRDIFTSFKTLTARYICFYL